MMNPLNMDEFDELSFLSQFYYLFRYDLNEELYEEIISQGEGLLILPYTELKHQIKDDLGSKYNELPTYKKVLLHLSIVPFSWFTAMLRYKIKKFKLKYPEHFL